MDRDEISSRLHDLYSDILQSVNRLPRRVGSMQVCAQIVDASSGAASNYNAARRARSRKEFVARLGVAVEEIDETVGWLEGMVKGRLMTEADAAANLNEARQLRAILAASYATARRNLRNL